MAARTGNGETPIRTLRVEGAEWERWADFAAALGISRQQLIRLSVSRVVRAHQSANNAASNFFDIFSNAPQGSGEKGRRSGEAKEAPRPESTAKLGGLRSN